MAKQMKTFNDQQQASDKIENFLDSLEHSETADDISPTLIESSESAYQDYQKGLDSGILLEEFKDQINCSSGVI
ncbi:hypothetical protein [Aphanothece sacrum]|uniref:Flagellar hook protein FlgK n=1 Tax=Aphanothece sacrum FPU1 TaxID=1920663 RepID=A0A401IGS2_APHSA|nr:hypothetical protein [Aphanothece sacrum]GBF80421.1 flagellar hook protein FlgK [Aphanothece sacrum FPU1]GBF84759.1 flagellar hook protein FlgK [Aphanothece sacrum FPU3]